MAKDKKTTRAFVPPVKTAEKSIAVNHKFLGIICALFAFILYANTISYNYMVDDGTVIKENKLTKAGISALPKIFTSAYRAGFWDRKEGLYRPLSVAMFAVEWQLAPDQPWLGHLINVLLYMLTGWLLYHLLRKLLFKHSPLIPLYITLLFIALPVHTEVVANIKSRDEILCFLFALLSMQQMLKWISDKKTTSLLLSVFTYFLSLLSKESAITFIAVFPLLAFFFTPANKKQLIMLSGAFFCTGLLFLGLRYAVIGTIAGTKDIQLINNSLVGTTDRVVQFATAMLILGKYLLLMLIPVTLIFDYSYNTIPLVGLGSFNALLSILVYAGLVWYAVKNFTKRDPIAFGIIFFFITISLVSNILFLIEATLAERFLYIPSFGFCIAVVIVLSALFKKQVKKGGTIMQQIKSSPALIILTFAIVLYSARTVARNLDWKDNFSLLEKDVKSAPNSARIRYAYGSALLVERALKEKDKNKKNQQLTAAISELEKGVALIDAYADAWYHLGVAYKELDDFNNAIRAFEKCRSLKPFKESDKFITAGLAYGMAKQYDKAFADFNEALKLDPKSTEALNNLGLYYNEAGRFNESVDALQKAIAIKPDFKMAYYNMGNSYANHGDYRNAMAWYLHALKFDAQYSDALNNIGNCYSTLSMRDSARSYYEKAVAADPGNVKALINMGVVLRQSGDSVNDKIWFQKARELGANI